MPSPTFRQARVGESQTGALGADKTYLDPGRIMWYIVGILGVDIKQPWYGLLNERGWEISWEKYRELKCGHPGS